VGSGGAGGSVVDGSVGGAKLGSLGVATEGNGSAVGLSGGSEAGMVTDAVGIETDATGRGVTDGSAVAVVCAAGASGPPAPEPADPHAPSRIAMSASTIGSAHPRRREYETPVPGKDVVARVPRRLNVSRAPRRPALTDPPRLERFSVSPFASRTRLKKRQPKSAHRPG
jgi:hypothetical protein